MDEEQIRAWLDENNTVLLSQIEAILSVKFTLTDKDSYGCQVHKNDNGEKSEVEIYYKEPLTQAKIAHELLHAKVDMVLCDGISLFDVPNLCKATEALLENADQIVNACEHYIFFPDYLDMGYREEDSFEEYELSDNSKEQIDYLCQYGLKKGLKYDINRVFQYLGLAFTLCFYPNEERFAEEKERLRLVDKVLYSKVDKLRDDCDIDLDQVNRDHLENAYRNFTKSINSWFLANKPK